MHHFNPGRFGFLALLLFLTLISAENLGHSSPAPTQPLVVVTTNIIGDVVREIAGDLIDLAILLPINADAHTFEPSPRDIARVVDANLVFINGFDFEQELLVVLENLGEEIHLISVSEGITPRTFGAGESPETHENEETHEGETGVDPHVWLNPNNVVIWADNIQKALGEMDPSNSTIYQTNAKRYQAELIELDHWIQERVSQIPTSERRLVTDHDVYGYFADRYGFELIGAVIPGSSTVAEPSARELAELVDVIRQFEVKAIFVGNTVNPSLAEQIASDTGVELVFVFTGSLSDEEGLASTYLDYMRFNVDAIVGALKG